MMHEDSLSAMAYCQFRRDDSLSSAKNLLCGVSTVRHPPQKHPSNNLVCSHQKHILSSTFPLSSWVHLNLPFTRRNICSYLSWGPDVIINNIHFTFKSVSDYMINCVDPCIKYICNKSRDIGHWKITTYAWKETDKKISKVQLN